MQGASRFLTSLDADQRLHRVVRGQHGGEDGDEEQPAQHDHADDGGAPVEEPVHGVAPQATRLGVEDLLYLLGRSGDSSCAHDSMLS